MSAAIDEIVSAGRLIDQKPEPAEPSPSNSVNCHKLWPSIPAASEILSISNIYRKRKLIDKLYRDHRSNQEAKEVRPHDRDEEEKTSKIII